MDSNEVIRRINANDKGIEAELWVVVEEFMSYKTKSYFNEPFYIEPNRIARWVKAFIKSVKEGKITQIDGSIEHYFWEAKRKRLTREVRTTQPR